MYLSIDGTDHTLSGRMTLNAAYHSADKGAGSLFLRSFDAQNNSGQEIALELDPWSPDGFRCEYWADGNAIVVCGAKRIVLLGLASLEPQAAIVLEYEECEIRDQPWFAQGIGVLIMASESRVFCFDKRLAIRWCWTVKAHSQKWWRIVAAPCINGDTVHIKLRSPDLDDEIKLDIRTAVQICD